MWLVAGREHGGDQFGMKQPVTSLPPPPPPPPPPPSLFLVPHVKRRQECWKGETTTENVLLPGAIWQGWITNRTHTNESTHTHTQTHATLCSESTSCLTFAHSWWLKCENTLARGLGSGWGLAQPPLPLKKIHKIL